MLRVCSSDFESNEIKKYSKFHGCSCGSKNSKLKCPKS